MTATPPAALLIDAENIGHSHVRAILAAATAATGDGEPRLRRAYGAAAHLTVWDDHGFRPCPSRPGKNAADMLLCVDAMDLALRQGFGTILIATSDGDFTYIVERLREFGIRVIGIGEVKAPSSFRAACTRFVTLADGQQAPDPKPTAGAALLPTTKLVPMVRNILTDATAEGGWCTAQWIGSRLKKSVPGFNHRLYGVESLEEKLKRLKYFDQQTAESGTLLFRDPNPLAATAPRHSARGTSPPRP